jgi:transcriptional regulator with PAS, ATPase and Fis domain
MHTKYSMNKNQEISEQDFIWEQFDNLFGPISKDMKVETLPEEVEKLEVKRIRLSLEQNQGNRTRTADELGIGRTNLIAKLRKYNLLDFVA